MVLERIMGHAWTGNVRELENAIERAVVVCRGDRIEAEDLIPISDGIHASRESTLAIPGVSLADWSGWPS